jgi:hypothetical protein
VVSSSYSATDLYILLEATDGLSRIRLVGNRLVFLDASWGSTLHEGQRFYGIALVFWRLSLFPGSGEMGITGVD